MLNFIISYSRAW